MVPTEIRAHFDVSFSVPDKASEVETGYTPYFILGGASSLKKAGTTDDNDILFELTADETEELATGHYWYQVVAETEPESSSSSGAGVSRQFIAHGEIWVIGKLTGEGAYDGRSVAKKIVDAIDAVLLQKATTDQQSYIIQSGSGSRSLTRCSPEELMELRKYYAVIVVAETRAASGGSLFKKHKFEFTTP